MENEKEYADKLFKTYSNLLKNQEYKKIIESFEKTENKEILDHRHYRIVAISYLNTYEYNKALSAFKKTIRLYPKIERRDYLIVEPLYQFAHKLLKNRQYEEFEQAKKLLLDFNPDYYYFRNLKRKKAFFEKWDKKGLFDQAITLLNYIQEGEKYLRLDVEREKNIENWEELCFDKLQRAKEVASDFDLVWELIGLYYLLILDFQEAEKNLKKAYTMNLGCETVKYNLGLLNEKRGYYQEAIKYFKEALSTDPEYNLAAEHIKICQAHIKAEQAEEHMRRGELEEALSKYVESQKLNPTNSKIIRKIEETKKKIFQNKLLKAEQALNNKDIKEAENILLNLPKGEWGKEEVKRLLSKLKDIRSEKIKTTLIWEETENRIKESEILISTLENIRFNTLDNSERFSVIQKNMLQLSEETQRQILNKINQVKTNDNVLEKFDELICSLIDEISITKSKFIPKKIDTNGQPVSSWLQIQVNTLSKKLIEKYPYWESSIPVKVTYDSEKKITVKEEEKIETRALFLLEKELKSNLQYQIYLLNDRNFMLLKTDNIIDVKSDSDSNLKTIKFKYEKVDFHHPWVQVHRYEIYSLMNGLTESSAF